MKFIAALVTTVSADLCCNTCEAPLVKYFSVDEAHGFCGESCMDPAKFGQYHLFEKNLTLATTNDACAQEFAPDGDHYTVYDSSPTHGVPGLLAVTLDLYAPTHAPDKSCCVHPFLGNRTCFGIPGKSVGPLTVRGLGPYCCPTGATEEIPCPSSPSTMAEIAAHVNSLQTTWKAEAPSKFESTEDVKSYLGAILKGDADYKEFLTPKPEDFDSSINVAVPTDFDVRTAFPDCAEVSGHIGDQSSCGSCWAFGSTMAFNDRRCIATGDKTFLSVEDTTANCGLFHCASQGCGGGHPGAAWKWFAGTGVVTGGGYEMIGQGKTCGPYSLAPCAHHVDSTVYPACPSSEYSTPSISSCTEASYGMNYKDDKIKAGSAYDLSGNIPKIQQDVMTYGSATMAFTVYDDFPTYKSGVYRATSSKALGGHAVRLLGWGVEDGQDYWLIANSWNEEWGNGGTFKIARGNNECGIEGNVQAGTASATLV